MENQHPNFLFVSTYLCIMFVGFNLMRAWINSKPNALKSKLPPGPSTLPFIGNLHLFIGTQPHHLLTSLAHKYGHVMHMKFGQVSTVVISSAEAAEQVMKTHDSIFSERPNIYAAEAITYNFQDIVFAHGDYSTQLRKICTLQLFSHQRVQSFRQVREEEMCNLVKTISEKAGLPINLKTLLYSSTLNIFSRIAFGGKSKQQDSFKKNIPDMVALVSGLSLVDLYPSFKWLHLINAMRPKNKRMIKVADDIFESIIHEHRAAKLTTKTKENVNVEDDLVHVLLDIQDHGNHELPLSTSSIKAILLDLFLGSSETTDTVVEWAMSELIRNPQVLKKTQAEVREVFTGRRVVDESGFHNLKYLNLVIKETLRLHSPAPLLLPRECQKSCEVDGFVIPAKSRVLVNVWAIGRSPSYWTEPEKFYPERFLDSSISYKGADFELIPFGAGRRMCPGMAFGIVNVELLLANLLYHFDWELPNGMKPEDLDMTEIFSTTLRRKEALCLVPTPYRYVASE